MKLPKLMGINKRLSEKYNLIDEPDPEPKSSMETLRQRGSCPSRRLCEQHRPSRAHVLWRQPSGPRIHGAALQLRILRRRGSGERRPFRELVQREASDAFEIRKLDFQLKLRAKKAWTHGRSTIVWPRQIGVWGAGDVQGCINCPISIWQKR